MSGKEEERERERERIGEGEGEGEERMRERKTERNCIALTPDTAAALGMSGMWTRQLSILCRLGLTRWYADKSWNLSP